MPSDAREKFFYKGYQFPVCARCTGVIISSVLAIGVFFKRKVAVWKCIVMSGVMFMDWFIQYVGVLESTNRRRFVTGLVGGFGYTTLHLYTYKFVLDKIVNKCLRRKKV